MRGVNKRAFSAVSICTFNKNQIICKRESTHQQLVPLCISYSPDHSSSSGWCVCVEALKTLGQCVYVCVCVIWISISYVALSHLNITPVYGLSLYPLAFSDVCKRPGVETDHDLPKQTTFPRKRCYFSRPPPSIASSGSSSVWIIAIIFRSRMYTHVTAHAYHSRVEFHPFPLSVCIVM